MLATLAAIAAAAPIPTDPTFEAPLVGIDPVRPGVGPAPGAEDSHPLRGQRAALAAVWTHRSLLWRPERGDPVAVVDDVVAARVAAAAGFDRIVLDVEIPTYIATTSAVSAPRFLFAGDPQIGARVVPLAAKGLSGSVFGKILPSFGAALRQLGERSVSGKAGLAVGYRTPSGLAFGADAAVWLRPPTALSGHALPAGAYVGLPAGPLDATASLRALIPLTEVGSAPVEALLSASTRGPVRLQLAGGTGVVRGVGAPGLRVMVGVVAASPGA